MQAVINACYGGFSFSTEAITRILDRKGLEYGVTTDRWGYVVVESKGAVVDHDSFDRNDQDVVAVVSEMGEAASGDHALLVIVEVEPDRLWRIAEYDGYESVEYFNPAGWYKS